MGRFDATKATIDANIKSNGNQEITGEILNSVMKGMVNATDAELTELSAEISGGFVTLEGTMENGNLNNGGGISASDSTYYMVYDLRKIERNAILEVSSTATSQYVSLWALHSAPYTAASGLTTLVAKGGLLSEKNFDSIDLSLYPTANYLYVGLYTDGEAVVKYGTKGIKQDIAALDAKIATNTAELIAVKDIVISNDAKLDTLEKRIEGGSVTLEGTMENGNLNNGGSITSAATMYHKVYDISKLDKSLILQVATTYKSNYTTLWALHSAPYTAASGLATLVAKGELTSIKQSDSIELSQYPTANYLYVAVGTEGNEAEVTHEEEGLAKSAYAETFAKLVELTNKAAMSWVDDDFTGVGYDGSISQQYQVVHDWCVANDIKCDFAIIPDAPLESMSAKLAVAREWENENFNFLFHPVHSEGWYNYSEANPRDVEKVKRSIVTGIRRMKEYGLLCPLDIMIWPGDSHTYDDNIEVVKNYMDMAISVTQNLNHAADSPRYKIARIGIEKLNKGMTMTELKTIIDEAVANGDWMIFYTHIHSIVIADDVTETGFTTANLFELLRYANDKVKLRPSAAIWRERKIMWEMSGK